MRLISNGSSATAAGAFDKKVPHKERRVMSSSVLMTSLFFHTTYDLAGFVEFQQLFRRKVSTKTVQ